MTAQQRGDWLEMHGELIDARWLINGQPLAGSSREEAGLEGCRERESYFSAEPTTVESLERTNPA